METVVRVEYQRVAKQFLLFPGMAVAELAGIMQSAFDCPYTPVALMDTDTRVVFPLSLVLAVPSQFVSNTFAMIANVNAARKSSHASPPLDLLNFAALDAVEVMQKFKQLSNGQSVGRAQFHQIFTDLLQEHGEIDAREATYSLDRLFSLFDRDGNGVVDANELLGGLTVLCSGDRDTNIRAAFELFDYDGDGQISLEEMQRFMTSMFAVMSETSPDVFRAYRVTPMQLAQVTAERCFQEADLDGDGWVSFDEFKSWYTSGGGGMFSFGESQPVQIQAPTANPRFAARVTRHSPSEPFAVPADAPELPSLESLRAETGLGELEAEDVLFALQEATDGQDMDVSAFYNAMASVLPVAADRDLLSKLFQFFDTNGDGVVEKAELASGLSVLCKGARDDKVRAVFKLLDSNGDGHISLDEMITYLTSVFRLLYQTSPGTEEAMGVDAAGLAEVTAAQCFEEADSNRDGQLSYDEFVRWYQRPSLVFSQMAEVIPDWLSLAAVRRLTNLQAYPVDQVLAAFASRAQDGALTRDAFMEGFQQFVGDQTEIERSRTSLVLSRLFSVFDTDGNGVVDFAELASGLTVLCGGSRDLKVESAFALYDFDGDGYISFDEMVSYLTSVFKVLYQCHPQALQGLSVTPEQLAADTAAQCFSDADLNQDGKLSLDEFKHWYSMDNSMDVVRETIVSAAHAPLSLDEVRAVTALHLADVQDLLQSFFDCADQTGRLSRAAFGKALQPFLNGNATASHHIVSRLFEVFDTDHNGLVDIAEAAAGISILCGGSIESKMTSAFRLFDFDNDGTISFDEMKLYLASMYKVMGRVAGSVLPVDQDPDKLAHAAATRAFAEADQNKDGRLTFDEFRQWYLSSGSDYAAALVDRVTHLFPTSLPQWQQATGLASMDISVVFAAVANGANENGLLTRTVFNQCLEHLYQSQGRSEQAADARVLLTRLFDLFDVDGNGSVDFAELASGLSVLCGSSHEDKVRAAFHLYDYNGDGYISLDEMILYLSSVFRVVYETEPGTAERMAVTPDELAEATAAQCFREADTNADGRLSQEEFQAWYFRNSPARDAVVNAASAYIATSVAELRAKSHLDKFHVRDVFPAFAAAADAQGYVSRAAFDACARSFARSLAPADASQSEATLHQLFELFDVSGSGKVDFTELATGLSLLCGGEQEERLSAAFALYDYNGDGHIARDELAILLTALYRVLCATQSAAEALGRPAESVARGVCDACFEKAEGTLLTYEQFKAWVYDGMLGLDEAPDADEDAADQGDGEHMSLESLRAASGLGDQPIGAVFEVFAHAADENGLLSREAFFGAMRQFMAPANAEDLYECDQLCDQLFALFDADGSGLVDFTELASGLSVLCGGSPQDKVNATFSLYDFNGDGFISHEEMVLYLTSVFKIMFATSPGTQAALGVSAAELAQATTDQCFQEADLNQDGRLSMQEFQAWYLSTNDVATAGAVVGSAQMPVWVSLDEVKRVTRLGDVTSQQLFEAFAAEADQNGMLSRAAFNRTFEALMGRLSREDKERARVVITRLFDVFDRAHTNQVDFCEVASGLTVLCGGTRESKERAAFALFDFDGDGYIAFDEMVLYLTSVFTVIYEVQPGTAERMGVPPEQLAQFTAQQCFKEADLNHDGRLSLDEFTLWYSRTGSNDALHATIMSSASAALPDSSSLAELRRVSGLSRWSVGDLFETFAGAADEHGFLDRATFNGVWNQIIGHVSRADAAKCRLALSRLFDVFDADHNGLVDAHELASGLTVLCGGDPSSKLDAAFSLYDYDGDGYISFEEMVLYLTSVFRVMYEADPATSGHVGVPATDLAVATARRCFDEADTDGDGLLSQAEFRNWYLRSGQGAATGPDHIVHDTVHDAVLGAATVPVRMSLADLKQVTGLGDKSVEHVFEVFASGADEQGLLDRAAFNGCFRRVMGPTTAQQESRTRVVLTRLFNLFDTDGNGVVDFSELASGLSVLCGGSEADKVSAAFALYDVDRDGYISFDEMVSYLTSVFKVVYEADPATQQRVGGVSPNELAVATAELCFANADQDQDGRLSLAEFRSWYTTAGQQAVKDNVLDSTTVLQGMSLPQLRAAAGLSQLTVDQVTHAVLSSARGAQLTREAFDASFASVIAAAQPDSQPVARQISDRLFDLFDTDHDGIVDPTELAAGLMVLCSGSEQTKIEAAFNMYDFDGDGYISFEEMVLYLTSVFKVMYQDPDLRAAASMSPNALAHATAQQCFADADMDRDGRLNMQEFMAWMSVGDRDSNSSVQSVVFQSAGMPYTPTLRQLQDMTHLQYRSPEEVFNVFADMCNDEGLLTRGAFNVCVQRLMGTQSANEAADVRLAASRLFDLFDVDHSGTVDFVELASGLSVLCGGSHEDKIRAAFQLFDVDGDGYITFDDMVLYLTSVFKVTLDSNPAAAATMKAAPKDLAVATTLKCFSAADLQRTGRLSLQQFMAWVSAPGDHTAQSVVMQASAAPPVPRAVPVAVPAATPAPTTSVVSESFTEARRLFHLAGISLSDAMRHAAAYTNADGALSRGAFTQCFKSLLGQDAVVDTLYPRLFNVFDTNHDGVVDFAELACGLTVLTAGDQDEKVRAVFRLFDRNGDGTMSYDEMLLFVGAVFKVMYELDRSLGSRTGMGADQLANASVVACFQSAGVPLSGALSYNQFRAWYIGSEFAGPSAPPPPSMNDPPAPAPRMSPAASAPLASAPTLAQLRAQIGLANMRLSDVAELLHRAASGRNGFLRARQLETAVRMLRGQVPASQEATFRDAINRVFSLFDARGQDAANVTALCCGLSVLCSGSSDDKVAYIFGLYDLNGDGFISKEEMVLFLTAAFRVLALTSDYGLPPNTTVQQIAGATAEQCFRDADVNHDGMLSLEEFTAWYSGGPAPSAPPPPPPAAAPAAPVPAPAPTAAAKAGGDASPFTIQLPFTTFHTQDVAAVVTRLLMAADSEGMLDRATFFKTLSDFVAPVSSHAQHSQVTALLGRLFKAFDPTGTGRVDPIEVAAGLTIVCGGSLSSRAEAAFSLYDSNFDAFMTPDELFACINALVKVLAEALPELVNESPSETAATAVRQVLQQYAVRRDGVQLVSAADFRRWFEQVITDEIDESPVQARGESPAPLQPPCSLQDMRRITNLGSFSVREVLEKFAASADADGLVSRGAFEACCLSFVKPPPRDPQLLARVLNFLFQLFDTDGNGSLDYSELAAGLSVLCGGSLEHKIAAAFWLYDLNGDGFITQQEMIEYLTSVFRVVLLVDPNARDVQQSAAELALATAQACFDEADSNRDGCLSLDEFKAWVAATPASQGARAAPAPAAAKAQAPNLGKPSRRQRSPPNQSEAAAIEALVPVLADQNIQHVMSAFAAVTDDQGLVRLDAFVDVLHKEFLATWPRAAMASLAHAVYHVFNWDGNEAVDYVDLVTGLSVLCGGPRDERLASVFALHDYDGQGLISQDDLVVLLTALFRILFLLQSDARHDPKQVAVKAAVECYHSLGKHIDSAISFPEFHVWYSEALAHHEHAALGDKDIRTESLSLSEMRRLTNFHKWPINRVLATFSSAADKRTGDLSRETFTSVFLRFLNIDAVGTDSRRIDQVLARLFQLFDADGNGTVDVNELAAGLSVLCGGNRDSQVAAAFALYDADGDGYITKKEMLSYLTGVFRVLFEAQSSTAEYLQCTPEELAADTTEQCFRDADTNGDGRLSRQDFTNWYNSANGAASLKDVVVAAGAKPPVEFSLSEVRSLTNLHSYTLEEALDVFDSGCDEDGNLDRQAFMACFHQFIPPQTGAEQQRTALVLDRLFDLFDVDGNGLIDHSEIAAGVSILCEGGHNEQVQAAFRLYDRDGDGFITREEMQSYLTSVFRVLQVSTPGQAVSVEDMAAAAVDECFSIADLNHDDRLSLDEFQSWYSHVGGADSAFSRLLVSGALRCAGIQELRRMTAMEGMEVNVVLSAFAAAADDEGYLDITAFQIAFQHLLDYSGVASDAVRNQAPQLGESMFAVFDDRQVGKVPLTEIAAGLSILCGGDQTDKIRAVFDLYDVNGDGFMSEGEMVEYLSSVYRIVYKSDPDIEQRLGVSPQELAERTAHQCFIEADINRDGRLSFEEFEAWLTRSPFTGTAPPSPGRSVSSAAFSASSIRSVLQLDEYDLEEVFDTFRENATNGVLSLEAFRRAFFILAALGGGLPSAEAASRVDAVINRLFQLFDTDRDGFVNFGELATGLTVFCSGSSQAKVRAAFKLYDYDNDGYISQGEMTKFLSCMFRVMYEIDPNARQSAGGAGPEQLAHATAQAAFDEADEDGDGRLSFQEFQQWYRVSAESLE